MECSFEVVDEKDKQDGFKLEVKADCFEEGTRWFKFTNTQIESGRWKKHVKQAIKERTQNRVSSQDLDEELKGNYTV